MRPFWVVYSKVSEQDTCLCKKCENILLHSALKREILDSNDLTSLLRIRCVVKNLPPSVISRNVQGAFNWMNFKKDVYYNVWEAIHEQDKFHKITYRWVVKNRHWWTSSSCYHFFNQLIEYMSHVGQICHQYSTLKNLKKNLGAEDYFIHINFSENYNCKYFRGIQTIHFGANRKQVSLYTGMIYTDKMKVPFCTISKRFTA